MRIEIEPGVRLYVDVDGMGLVPDGTTMRERPTLLLLHGGPGADHTLFKTGLIPELADVAQVVYYDHRGQGRSDLGTPDRWNLDTWADDVVRLCDALGIEKPVVLGASFGGMVAQRYLARHPEHPAKVVLACTSARLDVDTISAAFERVGGPEVASAARSFWSGEGGFDDYATLCLPLYSVSPPDMEAFARTTMNNDVLVHFQAGEQRTMDLRAGLANAQCPVLVVGAEQDPVCPIETNEEVAGALPAPLVRFERLAGVSHMEGCGDACVPLVRDFITAD